MAGRRCSQLRRVNRHTANRFPLKERFCRQTELQLHCCSLLLLFQQHSTGVCQECVSVCANSRLRDRLGAVAQSSAGRSRRRKILQAKSKGWIDRLRRCGRLTVRCETDPSPKHEVPVRRLRCCWCPACWCPISTLTHNITGV
jgi:hypothetical protein